MHKSSFFFILYRYIRWSRIRTHIDASPGTTWPCVFWPRSGAGTAPCSRSRRGKLELYRLHLRQPPWAFIMWNLQYASTRWVAWFYPGSGCVFKLKIWKAQAHERLDKESFAHLFRSASWTLTISIALVQHSNHWAMTFINYLGCYIFFLNWFCHPKGTDSVLK
jgi:hypothetical protein